MFNKKTEAKKTASKKPEAGAFDYNTLKAQAGELERAGDWTGAAELWQRVIAGSKNPMVVKMARGKLVQARATAKDNGQAAPPTPATPPSDATETPAEPVATERPSAPAPTKEPKAPKGIDARMPPVGTVIQKMDRTGAVRCECTVLEGGQIAYNGVTYKSISAAGLQASHDLGQKTKTVDGWAFFGLKKRPAGERKRDLVDGITKAFTKYLERIKSVGVALGNDPEQRAKVGAALGEHIASIEQLRALVAA